MPWDINPHELAAFVIDTVGEPHARQVRDVYAIDDDGVRLTLTSGWYWTAPCEQWPSLDDVLVLNRYDLVRRMTVTGLVAALGPVVVIDTPESWPKRYEPILPGSGRHLDRIERGRARRGAVASR